MNSKCGRFFAQLAIFWIVSSIGVSPKFLLVERYVIAVSRVKNDTFHYADDYALESQKTAVNSEYSNLLVDGYMNAVHQKGYWNEGIPKVIYSKVLPYFQVPLRRIDICVCHNLAKRLSRKIQVFFLDSEIYLSYNDPTRPEVLRFLQYSVKERRIANKTQTNISIFGKTVPATEGIAMPNDTRNINIRFSSKFIQLGNTLTGDSSQNSSLIWPTGLPEIRSLTQWDNHQNGKSSLRLQLFDVSNQPILKSNLTLVHYITNVRAVNASGEKVLLTDFEFRKKKSLRIGL
eukprot:1082430_1